MTDLIITQDKKQLVVGVPIPTQIVGPQVYAPADATARAALSPNEGDIAIQVDDGTSWLYTGTVWLNIDSRWDDLTVPLTETKVGQVKPPSFEQLIDDGASSTGVYAYHFSDSSEQELFFAKQVPHDWTLGTELRPHLHWTPKTAAAGDVAWGLEYTLAARDSVFGNTVKETIIASTESTALEHQLDSWSVISMSGITSLSTMLLGRIFRETGNVLDTYGAAAVGLEFDWHYLRSDNGSREEFTK